MDVHQIKQEEYELQMQPPPGFPPKLYNRQENGQGKCARANGYGNVHCHNVGLQEKLGHTEAELKQCTNRLEKLDSGNKRKEDADINLEDEKSDSCNKNAKEVAADDDDDDISEEGPEPEQRIMEVPDPEFYDFDKDRTEECLAADQVWAIRDDLDAMPRLYALIRKIYSPFQVKIIWLDFVSPDKDEIASDTTSDVPVACGKFKHGNTDTLESIGTFSHKIVCEIFCRNTYNIYPRKGEIWALWNIKWGSDPNNQYEFVEVLSDYTEDMGIMIAYLVKIKGFVCIFKPVNINNGMDVVQIPSNELLRFSHMVPSFRTTGKEREDVPEGYFELDPASLPSILEEVSDNVVVPRIPTSVPSSTTRPCEHPESEFYVFDVDKPHEKFQTDQVWALYGELDRLPRYYARINKVESYPKFKVHIQWLEASTPPKDVIHWFDNKMPTGCGIFSSGETAEFDETARFSHLAKGAVAWTRNKYKIYPREGEVWAIYREFSSEMFSSGLQTCQYDVVKVVKVNALDGTIKMLVLKKVSGYVTVFKIRRKAGRESILEISHCELLRFSHQIPAFPLTDEKERTLLGCWQLDPHAMPVSLTCLDSSTFCKETAISDRDTTGEMDSNGVRTNSDIVAEQRPLGPPHLDHYEIRKEPQFCKSKKRKKEQNTMDGGRKSTGGNSSTSCVIVYRRKRAEGASGRALDKNDAATVSNGVKSCDGSNFGSKDAAAHAKEMSLDCVDVIPSSVNEKMQIPSPPAHLKMPIIPETVFHNFNDERSSEKFKTGQIWALYFKMDDLPKSYARIESVELSPDFKLTIKWLELWHPPKGVIPWVDKGMPVCCGTFKVAFGDGVVFNNSISFCHQVSGVPSDDNSYTIYPRVGEVWALHSKLCSDLMCSNLKICEYYMVEILEVVDDCWIIISVLQSVTGFKTVFKAKERVGLDFTAIPWIELYRFSYQVPSFMLKEAKYAELRSCWELDPRSMPVHFYSSN